jgi:hypothetical protein
MKKYRTNLHPLFDEKYVQYKNESDILSNASERPNINTRFFNKRGMEVALLELKGSEEKGEYTKNDKVYVAHIPAVKEELEKIEQEYEQYCIDQVNMGFDEPEEMPYELFSKKLILEARLCIFLEEQAKLEKELSTFVEEVKQNNDAQVLKYGLVQSASLTNGIISEIDGQECSVVNGLLLITDRRSIYYGCKVSDYRRIAIQWRKDLEIKDMEELKKFQDEARSKGLPLPSGYSSFGNAIDPKDLPPIPENIHNYLITSEVIRTT